MSGNGRDSLSVSPPAESSQTENSRDHTGRIHSCSLIMVVNPVLPPSLDSYRGISSPPARSGAFNRRFELLFCLRSRAVSAYRNSPEWTVMTLKPLRPIWLLPHVSHRSNRYNLGPLAIGGKGEFFGICPISSLAVSRLEDGNLDHCESFGRVRFGFEVIYKIHPGSGNIL